MRTKCRKKLSSCILCIVLIVAMALMTTGCNDNTKDPSSSSDETNASVQADGNVLGEGSKQFSLTVSDADGSQTEFEIHTDQETVGAALQELELIDGEEGQYGLYVTTVNGITVDYDKDGMYWAFYVNDEYAQTGVDATEIKEGDSYALKAEKA
ncbi:MAG: DUF4430 domain-containing protein [Eubacterium sp.]|nr:DUF4430 domain-containing protein [Eubacterium sp.]